MPTIIIISSSSSIIIIIIIIIIILSSLLFYLLDYSLRYKFISIIVNPNFIVIAPISL